MLNSKRASSVLPVRSDLCLRHLTTARQRFVLLLQRLGFGTVHDLQVRAGDPVLDPPPRVVRRRKNGGVNTPRPQESASDFALKRELIEFFHDLDTIGDGTILVIEVAHGLPIIHEFEDVIPV